MADVALFGLGSAIVMLSPSFAILLLGRAIQGFGAGGIFPVASAVIGDTFPPEKRGGALGLIGAVFGLAFIVGPIVGGLLLLLSWHWIFAINLPIALVIDRHGLAHAADDAARRNANRLTGRHGVLAVLLAALAFGLNQIDTQNFVASLLSLDVWPFLLLALWCWRRSSGCSNSAPPTRSFAPTCWPRARSSWRARFRLAPGWAKWRSSSCRRWPSPPLASPRRRPALC